MTGERAIDKLSQYQKRRVLEGRSLPLRYSKAEEQRIRDQQEAARLNAVRSDLAQSRDSSERLAITRDLK